MTKSKSTVTTNCFTKPMLGETIHDISILPFPLGATYKADGIRAIKLNDQMLSRTLKPIRNTTINDLLSSYLPDGADGEILVGKTFQDTTSAVMTEIGSANFQGVVKFYWFDWIKDGNIKEPYQQRCENITEYINLHKETSDKLEIIPLIPKVINNVLELEDFEREALSKHFEGVVLRKLDSPYKCGRSTLKQAWMLKLKRFEDDEATIIDFVELLYNHNEAKLDERGYTKRSSHKDNQTASGILGSFKVTNTQGVTFNIGTGLTHQQRVEYWQDRDSLIGKIVKYKFFNVGVLKLPRFPSLIGFRDVDDL